MLYGRRVETIHLPDVVEMDAGQIAETSERSAWFRSEPCPFDGVPYSEHTWLKIRRIRDADGLLFGWAPLTCDRERDREEGENA